MEGKFGGAYLHLRDPGTGFARWLRLSGHSKPHHRSGICYFAPTKSHSVDRAKPMPKRLRRFSGGTVLKVP
jgi:hypothetical protein